MGLYLKASSDIQILNEYNGEQGFFIKTFAFNDKRNKNGWRVTWDSIQNNISDFSDNQRPGILYNKCENSVCDLDHTDGSTYKTSLQVQEPFRVTDIVGHQLNEDTHTGYFIHRLTTNPNISDDVKQNFKDAVVAGQIKYVSPSVWPVAGAYDFLGYQENGLPILDVYDWKALHDAFVNDPAFGDEAKVTAVCEGPDCMMRMLSAAQLTNHKRNQLKDSQFAYVDKDGTGHLPIHDANHVRNALARFNQTDIPEDEKSKAKAKLCRAAKRFDIDSDFCSEAVSAADDLAPLEQVPLLLKHKGSLHFVSASAVMAKQIEDMISEKGKIETELLPEIFTNNSFSACSCSSKLSMDQKDYEAKLKAATEEMEAKDKQIKDLESKVAALEKANKAKKGKGDNTDPEDDDENQKNIKAMKATIDKLQTELSGPIVAKMLKAREDSGATKEELQSFQESLKGKTFEEVSSLYANEKIMIENLSARAATPGEHFEFNGGQPGALSGKSLEEIMEEAV